MHEKNASLEQPAPGFRLLKAPGTVKHGELQMFLNMDLVHRYFATSSTILSVVSGSLQIWRLELKGVRFLGPPGFA